MARGPNLAGLTEDDAVSGITESEVVCETCGSGSAPHLIANCAWCNAHAKERLTGHPDPNQDSGYDHGPSSSL